MSTSALDLSSIRGFLLDIDGVVTDGSKLVSGTKSALRALRERDLPHVFVTNTTSRSRRQLWEKLRGLGVPCAADDILSAPRVAAALLRERRLERCLLLAPEATREDFLGAGIDVVPPEAPGSEPPVPAVVVGDLGDRFTFTVLNNAFRRILDGALLVSMSPNRYWKAPDGLRLDAGPFVAALEHATGATALVAAKPSADIFREGCRILGASPGETLMVGDDAEMDVAGARRAGLRAALVRTGKYRPGDEGRFEPKPEAVVDNLLQLVHGLPEVP